LRKINNIDKEIFIKTVDTQGGDNCFVLNSLNIETIADELMNIKVLLFQERLKQHEVIKNIYPYSINTLRIDTYIDDSGEVIFLSSLIRFGANKSVVDNPGTSGGFFVPVNVETGEIKKRGMQFLKLGGNFYYNHPETKEVFGEIKIPYFNDAKTLIKRALKVVPEKMVGWDIAITENGPVIIEGNDNPSLFMSDLAIGGYKKNVTMRKILKLINNKDRK